MARHLINLGSSPHGENCAQVGEPDFELHARAECVAFINQLSRVYKHAHGRVHPEGIRLKITSHQHDFGTYYDVAVVFDDNDEAAVEAAFWFDENVPELWDNEAKNELRR